MTKPEIKVEKITLEELIKEADKNYQLLLDVQSMSIDYLSQEGRIAKRAYQTIWSCLIFSDSKEEAKCNLEKAVEDSYWDECKLSDEIVEFLSRYHKRNFL